MRDDEMTGRTRLAAEAASKAASAESSIKRVYAVVAILITCLGAGFVTAQYLGHLAHAEDLRIVAAQQEADRRGQVAVDARVGALEEQQRRLDRRMDWFQDTLWSVAQKVRAHAAPPPAKR